MVQKTARRADYFNRLTRLIEQYSKVLIVHADFVGSRQMAEIRLSLRGKAVVLMGKNTMIRTALRGLKENMPQLDNLLPEIQSNMGLVFCLDDPAEVREIIMSNKLPAAAKEGAIAPVDVVVPAGPTGLDSNQTSFFQALNISTRVTKSQVEILNNVDLIKKGQKVGPSEATLLNKLKIKPFSYGLVPRRIYDDGSVYDSTVLDIKDEDILGKFCSAAQNVAALSRQIGFPTSVSVTHSIVEGFKFCAALCIESGDFDFPQMETLRKFVEDPTAFAAAAPVAAAVATETKAEAAPAAAEESEEEEDMGFSLFD